MITPPPVFISRPALGVCDVELKTALSDASRAKSVDTAKIRMSVGGQRLTVDVLPTIGLEVTHLARDDPPPRYRAFLPQISPPPGIGHLPQDYPPPPGIGHFP